MTHAELEDRLEAKNVRREDVAFLFRRCGPPQVPGGQRGPAPRRAAQTSRRVPLPRVHRERCCLTRSAPWRRYAHCTRTRDPPPPEPEANEMIRELFKQVGPHAEATVGRRGGGRESESTVGTRVGATVGRRGGPRDGIPLSAAAP